MEIVITAVGPDNVGLADPIIHDVTTRGANIAEIQMYDHDEAAVFAMMCRIHIAQDQFDAIQQTMSTIAQRKGLEIRVWSPESRADHPNLAICTTLLEHSPRAVLNAVRCGKIQAKPVVVIGNRRKCESLANEFGVPFEYIGREDGSGDDDAMVRVIDHITLTMLCWHDTCEFCLPIHVGSLQAVVLSICTTVCCQVFVACVPIKMHMQCAC
jgi:formyltetrahydrofolate deformylase